MILLNMACMFLLVQYSHETNKTDETDAPEKSVFKQCIHEENPHPAHIWKLKEGQFVDDPKLKCFLKCCLIKNNEMTSNGSLIAENIKENLKMGLNDDEKSQVIENCGSEDSNDDLCEFAYNVIKCITENVYKLYN